MLFRRLLAVVALLALLPFSPAGAQEPDATLVFKSSVDVVSMTAVVRDRKGRVVPALTRQDFQVLEDGRQRQILDLHAEDTAPASVALLIDGSGSMRMGASHEAARKISEAVLGSMNARRDDAALFSFDTRLLTLNPFTHDFDAVRKGLDDVQAWGSTSLFDAIAGTAGIVGQRTQNRRAVVVLTDGMDTTSTYTPERVSAIASSIDVPIYVFALGLEPGTEEKKGPHALESNSLAELARMSGGDYFVANTPALVNASIKHLLEELRYQYVIGFEASAASGLRRVEIRTRKGDLSVRTRRWYSGGAGE